MNLIKTHSYDTEYTHIDIFRSEESITLQTTITDVYKGKYTYKTKNIIQKNHTTYNWDFLDIFANDTTVTAYGTTHIPITKTSCTITDQMKRVEDTIVSTLENMLLKSFLCITYNRPTIIHSPYVIGKNVDSLQKGDVINVTPILKHAYGTYVIQWTITATE